MSTPAAGWYDDPEAPGRQRYWDGQGWASPGSEGSYESGHAGQAGGWEYHVEQMSIAGRWSEKRQAEEIARFQSRLNDLGRDNWEMVSYESIPMYGEATVKLKGLDEGRVYAYLTFFKRPRS